MCLYNMKTYKIEMSNLMLTEILGLSSQPSSVMVESALLKPKKKTDGDAEYDKE